MAGRRTRGSRPPPSEQVAWTRLVNWLALGPRTRSQAALRLRVWKVEEGAADRLLLRLDEAGLVDDEAFAEAYARELARKGLWGQAVTERLRARGVPAEVAAAAARQVSSADPIQRARDVARRRARSLPDDPTVARRRLVAHLVRRGFSHGVATQAADQALNEHRG